MRAATAVLAAVLALVLAGCGDDEGTTSTPQPLRELGGIGPQWAKLTPEQKIERTGDKWAPLFAAAADRAACRYMTQPACERMRCKRIAGPIENCTPPSSKYRKSFADATIKDVVIKGNKAGAKFSNGEAVELDHVSGYEVGGLWWIHKVGGDAGRKLFRPVEVWE